MRCTRVDRLLERYVDGRLPRYVVVRVHAHIEGCERCRAREKRARVVASALRPVQSKRAPDGFTAALMQRIYREQPAAASGNIRLHAAPATGNHTFRRLGYSFVATAALLAASLFIPRIAYPSLIDHSELAAQLSSGQPTAVAHVIREAGTGFRQAIGAETRATGVY